MTIRWFIGLASGSSADGVDAVLLQTEGVGLELHVRVLHTFHQPYGKDLRDLIQRAAKPGTSDSKQAGLLHRLLGETFAAAARQVADQASFSLQKVQCIACPGHTLWHEAEGRFPSTLALGMAAIVAERTGLTTVSDFRTRDLAVGGQGAPLAALPDYLLFRPTEESRVLIHLGSAARVVYLPARCRLPEVLSFEAGPCNVLLDELMLQLTGGREAYDPGGKHAVQGCCIEELLQRWLGHPYLQRRPPKTLARLSFGADFVSQAIQQGRQTQRNLHDLLCTATHFVARGITEALRRFLPLNRLPAQLLLSGGGVRNGLLWQLLGQQLPGVKLDRTDVCGIPWENHNAVIFGILAALTVDGVPANVPSATGAAGSRLLGSLTPGSSSNWARCLAWMAAQTAPPTLVRD